MLNQYKKKREQGFTIIEVMIVLAIAGLIIMIVFLAVPALQRNSRNTQYRNDAANYNGAIAEWMNNNNGKAPASYATDIAGANGVNSLAKLGILSPPTAIVSGAQSSAVAIGSLQIVTVAKCDPTTVGNTIAGTSRSVAVRYSVENSAGGTVPQCVD